ncbi:MAG: hypothetical protein WBD16_14785 [Pyrinomonadaceae bacterium]
MPNRFVRPIFGFLDVVVGRVEAISNETETLLVIQNEPGHAEICGIPNQFRCNDIEKAKLIKKKAIALGRRIADEAATVDVYTEEGFSPTILVQL